MDKLLACAKTFDSLIDEEYRILIAHKNNQVELKITFAPIDFHHLMGLGKLKDLRIHRDNRTDVFKKILNGKITYDTIRQSKYIQEIGNRFEPLSQLEELLDSNYLTFRYRPENNPASTIIAEYLLSVEFKSNDVYIFLDKKENAENYFCRSFFPKTNKDYTIGQTKYTLLRKEKITLSTGESVIQWER